MLLAVNALGQNSHLYGRSPECTRRCCVLVVKARSTYLVERGRLREALEADGALVRAMLLVHVKDVDA